MLLLKTANGIPAHSKMNLDMSLLLPCVLDVKMFYPINRPACPSPLAKSKGALQASQALSRTPLSHSKQASKQYSSRTQNMNIAN